MLTFCRHISSSRVRIPNLRLSSFSRKSSNPFPYPQHPNPSPYQIFHLPPQKASQTDVKSRYYDLVRIYHPDSAIVRSLGLPPEVAHARFQSITKAYDLLRGKSPMGRTLSSGAAETEFTSKARRTRQARQTELHTGRDDRWKDWVILGAVVAALCIFAAQTTATRLQVMAELSGKSRQAQIAPTRNRASRTLDEDRLAAPEVQTIDSAPP